MFIPNKIQKDTLKTFSKGKVLMEYRDDKGRLVKKYSKEENYKNYVEKNKRSQLFEKNIQKILHNIERDLKSSILKKRESALILYTIYKTGLRIGSNTDTKANVKAYGISTLLNKHVTLDPSKKYIYLDFIGKKGVRNTSLIKDDKIYEYISKRKTTNWSEPLFHVSSSYVRKYFKDIDNRFKIKDFRSLKANSIARNIIDKKKGPASTEKKFKKWQLKVADYVAKKLGNTRAVALNDYIDPALWNKWRKPEWGPFIPKKLIVKDD